MEERLTTSKELAQALRATFDDIHSSVQQLGYEDNSRAALYNLFAGMGLDPETCADLVAGVSVMIVSGKAHHDEGGEVNDEIDELSYDEIKETDPTMIPALSTAFLIGMRTGRNLERQDRRRADYSDGEF